MVDQLRDPKHRSWLHDYGMLCARHGREIMTKVPEDLQKSVQELIARNASELAELLVELLEQVRKGNRAGGGISDMPLSFWLRSAGSKAREGTMLKAGPAKNVSIYVGEDHEYHGQSLYSAILNFLFYHGISGASVVRGVAGFGADHHLHTTRIEVLTPNENRIHRVGGKREEKSPARVAAALEAAGQGKAHEDLYRRERQMAR
jgi:Uncharacterized ACR, COG1993